MFQSKSRQNAIAFCLVALLLLAVLGAIFYTRRQPGAYDAFAQCLTERGAVFYGAFWCPHCQSQKRLFGKSARLLPYVECSTPDGRGQTFECNEKEIEGYPTWIFANGERLSGEIPLETLAEKTGCSLESGS